MSLAFYINPQIVPIGALIFLLLAGILFVFIKIKKSVHSFIRVMGLFSSLWSGLTLIGFFFYQNYRALTTVDYAFLIAGIIILFFIIVLTIFKRFRNLPLKLMLLITFVCYTWFTSEIIVNILVKNGHLNHLVSIADGTMGAFNCIPLSPDLTRGYAWKKKPIRIFKVVNGNVVYDRSFTPNNAGIPVNKDYTLKKDSGTYRFIVLGDSYTAAEFIDTPWPESAQKMMNKPNDHKKYEFYSFALDGIGLYNWHRILFKEIIPEYEFDALILAIYGDDLHRDFFMMNADSSHVYGSYSANAPRTLENFYIDLAPSMPIAGQIIPDSIIQKGLKMKNFSTSGENKTDNLYLLSLFHRTLQSIEYQYNKKFYIERFYTHNQNKELSLSIEDVKTNIGENKFLMLEEIISFCKNNDKPLLLVSVPHIEFVKNNNINHSKSMSQKELEAISKHSDILYYDMYPFFQKLSYDSLQIMYLKNDAHWNQAGSDYFAKELSILLKENF